MTTTVTGPGIFLARNIVYDLPEHQAGELLDAHYAIPAYVETPAAKRETAVRKPSETR